MLNVSTFFIDNDMKKHSSVSLKGITYDVMQLENPKAGCHGQCDYYYHCEGECALKSIVGSHFRFYTLKLR